MVLVEFPRLPKSHFQGGITFFVLPHLTCLDRLGLLILASDLRQVWLVLVVVLGDFFVKLSCLMVVLD